MTIQQIEYILEVSRTGSISQAAERLFVAQSNLSSSIRALEQELNVQIFTRSNHGVRPTAQGLHVLEAANQILVNYERMRLASDAQSPLCVRLGGVAYEPVNLAYVRLCGEYAASPLVDFSYYSLSLEESVNMLYLSMLDIAVHTAMPDNGPNSLERLKRELHRKNIHVSVLAEIPFVLRMGPHHPLYKQETITPEDINEYPVVDYCGNLNYGKNYTRTAYSGNTHRVFRVMDRTDKHRLVETTDAVSFGLKLPASICQQYRFREYPIGGTNCLLLALYSESKVLDAVSLRYLELLREEISDIRLNAQ